MSNHILECIYPKKGGPRIDMWEMDSACHTFGYWENGEKAGPNDPPKIKLKLPIMANGNYPGDPQAEFYDWLSVARQNPEIFNIESYMKRFCSGL